MISAPVKRALEVAGFAGDATLESLLRFLVQHRQTGFELSLLPDGRWRAIGRWPGPDAALAAEGQGPDDAVAKIVLDVIAREGPPQSSSR